MQKIQVFLREDQKEKLKRLSAQRGMSQSDLVRRGVDLILAAETENADWKNVTRQLFGLWKDHDTIEEDVKSVREYLAKRHEKLLS